ncbi:flagellar biosynthetic protein FliR [Uliginosibacterium sp. H3]|uniref:Flagellar biosynthetic protein FliR n=1 Tax=Uliginosibacterium silvisoli TaxID=3114758 RepID=A0ABU6K551_9RHOO|nr:flagellar biosynthetic protein FliR [Uliginosibacterium sp. H3]
MFTITSAQLDALLLAYTFPMVRVMSFLAAAPLFNNVAIPRRVKLIVALAVGFAITSALPPQNLAAPGSDVGLAILGMQILIGAGMGFAMRVVFAALDVAGELIGLQMGLSFATFFDPQSQSQTSVVAEIIGIVVSLLFLALNGHLMLIQVLIRSFEWLPISANPVHAEGWLLLARSGAIVFATGLLLALPVVVALLITNIALAVLTRAAPQLNLFAVGFPITSTVGIAVIWLTLPTLANVLEQIFDQGFEGMALLVRVWTGT